MSRRAVDGGWQVGPVRRRWGAALAVGAAVIVLVVGLAGAGTAAASLASAATPYMGWNTYYAGIDMADGLMNTSSVEAEASAMSSDGLEAAGYRYIWLDANWDWCSNTRSLCTRNGDGTFKLDPAVWPSDDPNDPSDGIRDLAEWLHARGFKLGIYVDADDNGCAEAQTCGQQYQKDVNTFASWGVDAIKVDVVGLGPAAQTKGWPSYMTSGYLYPKFSDAVQDDSPARPMVLLINDYLTPGVDRASEQNSSYNDWFTGYNGGNPIANAWRTDTDIGYGSGSIPWSAVLRNLDGDAAHPEVAGPGHWNDPDYLGPQLGMTSSEAQAQFTMWAMLSAPLMIASNVVDDSQSQLKPTPSPTASSGRQPTPLGGLSSQSLGMLENRGVIAIDQDALGAQATPLSYGVQGVPQGSFASGEGQVWVKKLANGNRAIAFLNRSGTTVTVGTNAAALGLAPHSSYTVNDLWNPANSYTTGDGTITASVPADSAVLYRVSVAPGSTTSGNTDCTSRYGGNFLCAYGMSGPYRFPDGTQRYWVVAPDHSVWMYDTGTGNWSNQGNAQGASVSSGVSFSGHGWGLTECVLAGTVRYDTANLPQGQDVWCDSRGNNQTSVWGGWYDTGLEEPTDTDAALTSCPWNGGSYYCQYGVSGPHVFPDNTAEEWVVGGNNEVWTRWEDESGAWHWQNLGGGVTDNDGPGGIFSSVTVDASGWGVTIYGRSPSGCWSRVRGPSQYGSWSAWTRVACPN